jgi:hypothetical protein
MPPELPGGSCFVTPKANGYARFMRSIRSQLVGFCATASLVILGAFSVTAGASATLYKWVDADGVTHYSDRPAPGSEKVQIASAQTYKSNPSAGASPNAGRKPAGATSFKYTRMEITRPTEGEAFVNNGGHVDASAVLEPDLLGGHQVWFVLDGTRQPEPSGAGLSAAFQVDRGTHTLSAVVTDSAGHELISAPGVTFYVREPSVNTHPPRGPALTPPKKG